jgi:hypothetical protein
LVHNIFPLLATRLATGILRGFPLGEVLKGSGALTMAFAKGARRAMAFAQLDVEILGERRALLNEAKPRFGL